MDNFAFPVEDVSPNKRKGLRRKSKRTGSWYARSDPALEINQPRHLYDESPDRTANLPRLPFPAPIAWSYEREFVESPTLGHAEPFGNRYMSYSMAYPLYGPAESRAFENRNSWNGSLQPYRPHRRTSQPRNYTPGMYNRPSAFDCFHPIFRENSQDTGSGMSVTNVPNSPRTSGPGLVVSSNLQSPRNRGPGLIVSSTSKSAHNPGPRVVSSTPSLRLNPEAREFVPTKEPRSVPFKRDWADEHLDAEDTQDHW